jgi:alpha-tubulin suppressor-like RCC1 family protein
LFSNRGETTHGNHSQGEQTQRCLVGTTSPRAATQNRIDLGVERQGLLLVEQEDPSVSRSPVMIQDLLWEAGRTELQLAYKLLKALVR